MMDSLTCSYCPIVLNGLENFKYHLEKDHGIVSSVDLEKRIYCKTQNCKRSYANARNLYDDIKKKLIVGENVQADKQAQQFKIEQNKEIDESIFPFDSLMSNLIANMRVASTVGGSEFGRYVTQVELLLTDVMKEVKIRVENFFESKKIDVNDETTKTFLNQFKFHSSFPKYKDLRGQISVMKQKYNFIEPMDVAIGYKTQLVVNSEKK